MLALFPLGAKAHEVNCLSIRDSDWAARRQLKKNFIYGLEPQEDGFKAMLKMHPGSLDKRAVSTLQGEKVTDFDLCVVRPCYRRHLAQVVPISRGVFSSCLSYQNCAVLRPPLSLLEQYWKPGIHLGVCAPSSMG